MPPLIRTFGASTLTGRSIFSWGLSAASITQTLKSQFDATVGQWPFEGIIWDELKNLKYADHSDSAKAKVKEKGLVVTILEDPNWIVEQAVGFIDDMTAYAASLRSDLQSGLFIYGHMPQYMIEACASMEHVQAVGLDGRPYSLKPKPEAEHHPDKSLIDQGPDFKRIAKLHGKKSLMLIENHDMPESLYGNMERELPEVLAMNYDHVLFYYYPRNLTDPDRQMSIVRSAIQKHLSQ